MAAPARERSATRELNAPKTRRSPRPSESERRAGAGLFFDFCDRISSRLIDFFQAQATEPGKKPTINETSIEIQTQI
jgi:hypothetical protein